jgi:type I restriction enzyme S subunit
MKWGKVKVGDCCEVTSSKRIFFSEYVDSGVPFYRSKEIIESSNGQAISEPLFISQEKYDEIKNHFGVPQSGDMLLTSVGTIGVPYIVREKDYFYFKDGNLTWFRNFSDELDSKYLYFWVKSSEGQSILNNTTIGSSQKALTIASLKGLEIPCPPSPVQKRIVEFLAGYDDLIENNQKQIKLLEEAAQRLYKEWFVDLRFPGHETTPIVDGIPQGWERMVLSEVTSVLKRGISPKYSDNGKYSVINQKCIRSSIMDISESRRQEKEYVPTLNLQDSDTVICSTGTGTLGRVGRVYGDYPNTTFDSHVTLVRAKENPNYIYHVVKSQQEYLMGMGRGSTNQQELYRDVIERLVVLCPSQDILLKADRVLNAIHCKIKAVYLQNNLLVESRDRLLPKLMSGELEV